MPWDPNRKGFLEQLHAVAEAADVVEIGVPFSDPMDQESKGLISPCPRRIHL